MSNNKYEISQTELVDEENSKNKKPLPKIFTYIAFALALVLAFFAGTAVKNYVLVPVEIAQTSMFDTLEDGDKIYVYRLANIEQFDIVVFDEPLVNNNWVIKRVIAVGGQEVEITDGILYITENGVTTAYIEKYVYGNNITQERVYIPEGYYYLLGDNREASYDSEDYGCINVERIIGKAVFVDSENAVVVE
ncbi:MAG: signal peptidase I [Bacillota bacterium]